MSPRRVIVALPRRPESDRIRRLLREFGFAWTPSVGAWSRRVTVGVPIDRATEFARFVAERAS